MGLSDSKRHIYKYTTREHGDASPPTELTAEAEEGCSIGGAIARATRDSSNPRNRCRPIGARTSRPDEPAGRAVN